MPRSRRSSSNFKPVAALILVLLLAGGGWWLWPQRAPARADGASVDAATGTGAQEIALPPPRTPTDSLCARLGDLRVASLLGTASVSTAPLSAENGVPRAAGCTWRTAEGGEVKVMWFNDASLASGQIAERGAAYFQSAVTGFEYAMKVAPERITGVGDEAAAAGFIAPASGQGQVIVRRGEHVLTLEARGVARSPTVRLAETLVAQF